MKKEIKEIITVDGKKVYRITTSDERFYGREIMNEETGLPEIKWFPSVTWIKSYYYTSPYLVKWIADKGLTEAERIKKEAGTKGDKIHQATEEIDKGTEIKIDEKFLNKETEEMEELTGEEIEAILSYRNYVDRVKPELLANEMTIFAKEYAGTLDRIWAVGYIKDGVRQIWIIDIKSSKSIWKDMIIQVSAYSHANIDYQKLGITGEEWKNRKLAILQVGYQRNKNKYKLTEIPDRYDLFEIAYKTWEEENPDAKPKERDYPLVIKSEFRAEQLKNQQKVIKKPIKKKNGRKIKRIS